jgi:hypothetical protein
MEAKVTAANTRRGNHVARCALRTRRASSRALDSSRRGSSPAYADSVVMTNRLAIQTDLRRNHRASARQAIRDHQSNFHGPEQVIECSRMLAIALFLRVRGPQTLEPAVSRDRKGQDGAGFCAFGD